MIDDILVAFFVPQIYQSTKSQTNDLSLAKRCIVDFLQMQQCAQFRIRKPVQRVHSFCLTNRVHLNIQNCYIRCSVFIINAKIVVVIAI